MKHTFAIAAALFCLVTFGSTKAEAATTPPYLLYESRLLNSEGGALTTSVTLRFSFWTINDWTASDTGSGGVINTNSSTYGGWQEVHTTTPTSNGIVSVQLGSVSALPTIDYSKHRYVQVEVKAAGDPDTSYALLDPTGDSGADSTDRKFIGAIAFAKNAEAVDNRSPGTGSGDLLILNSDAVIGTDQMGSATNVQNFTINAGSASGDTVLTFGNAILAETLKFSGFDRRFDFSDDLHVTGNLSSSGSLTVEGNARLKSTLTIGGVTYTFPEAEGIMGQVLKSDGSGSLVWAYDIDTDTDSFLEIGDLDARFLKKSGGTMTGALTVESTIHGDADLTIDGNLTINAHSSGSTATMTFGNAILAETLRFSSDDSRFDFSDDLYVDGNFEAKGSIHGESIKITSLQNCDSIDTDIDGNFICGDNESGGSTAEVDVSEVPPVACTASTVGSLWMNTNTDGLYTCNASSWLSISEMMLIGEQDDSCSRGDDVGDDDDCAIDFGDDLGPDTRRTVGIYLPNPITITGYGFSTDDNRSCLRGGNFDIEAWGSGSPDEDNTYALETVIASGLTGETENGYSLNAEVSGNQYVLFGLDNNCRGSIRDFNLVLFYKWRHE